MGANNRYSILEATKGNATFIKFLCHLLRKLFEFGQNLIEGLTSGAKACRRGRLVLVKSGDDNEDLRHSLRSPVLFVMHTLERFVHFLPSQLHSRRAEDAEEIIRGDSSTLRT